MNREIHELINLKALRLEIEVGLGISNVFEDHLSKSQLNHIRRYQKYTKQQFKMLNRLNHAISIDESIITKRHWRSVLSLPQCLSFINLPLF